MVWWLNWNYPNRSLMRSMNVLRFLWCMEPLVPTYDPILPSSGESCWILMYFLPSFLFKILICPASSQYRSGCTRLRSCELLCVQSAKLFGYYIVLNFVVFAHDGDWLVRMSGVQLECSRAVAGFTMRFTALSRTSCSSGGHWTISSSKRLKPSRLSLLSRFVIKM